MAYDIARGRTILFGGLGVGGYLGDTWEWDGATWTQRATTGPSPRGYHAMAYDGARGKTVLFGGNAGAYLGDTWEWDGATWIQRASTGPHARGYLAVAFDSMRGMTVLFGGSNGATDFDDTWEYQARGGACSCAVGSTCTNSACDSGFCADGVCCSSACTDVCGVCNLAGSVGICAPVSGTPAVGHGACAAAGSTCGGSCDGLLTTACTRLPQSSALPARISVNSSGDSVSHRA